MLVVLWKSSKQTEVKNPGEQRAGQVRRRAQLISYIKATDEQRATS